MHIISRPIPKVKNILLGFGHTLPLLLPPASRRWSLLGEPSCETQDGAINPREPQELGNILWGTTTPVLLTLSSGIAQVRARGSCSTAVTNPRVFAQILGDSARMATQVKGIIVNKVTDALFEVNLGKSGLIDIISSSDEMSVKVKAIADPPLNAIGLTLKHFEIHAIEGG